MRYSHREFVTDILSGGTLVGGSTSFNLQRFDINPGLFGTFPWGSSIANNFTKYRFVRIAFQFVSQSGTALNSTNTALGKMFARYQPDPTIPVDASQSQMVNSADCHSAVSYRSWHYPLAIQNANFERTLRAGGQPSGTDLRMYDYGYFEIATIGQQAVGIDLGQLWVRYEVVLEYPLYRQGLIGDTVLQSMSSSKNTTMDWTNASPLGVSVFPVPVTNNFIVLTVTGNQIAFPSNVETGRFMILFQWVGAGALVTKPVTTVTNAVFNVYFEGRTTGLLLGPGAGVSSGRIFFAQVIDITAPGDLICTFDLDGSGTLPPSGGANSSLDIMVIQLNGTMNNA